MRYTLATPLSAYSPRRDSRGIHVYLSVSIPLDAPLSPSLSFVYSTTTLPTRLPPDFFSVILRKDLSFVSTDNSLKLQKRFDGHDDERLVGAFETVKNPGFKSKCWILFKKFDCTLRRPCVRRQTLDTR